MSHYIEYCKECKKVISQCRCPSNDKEVRYGLCKECADKNPIPAYRPDSKLNPDDTCKICGRIFYNCVCSHED